MPKDPEEGGPVEEGPHLVKTEENTDPPCKPEDPLTPTPTLYPRTSDHTYVVRFGSGQAAKVPRHWKSKAKSSVKAAQEEQPTKEELIPETQQADDNPSKADLPDAVAHTDDETDPEDEEEDYDDGVNSSDEEWNPTEEILLAEELAEDSDLESEGEDEGGANMRELCTDCGSFVSVLKPHTCEYKIKPYCCNICGKRCVTEFSLQLHSKIHEETYKHTCTYCHAVFKTRVNKLKHEQVHQKNRDRFNCTLCPVTFPSGAQRKNHMKKTHGCHKGYKCEVCGVDFPKKASLQRHEAVHTGLKRYKCSVCKRGFKQSGHLKSHMRLHTGEKPYQCQHCDKCFNHNVSLKSHVQRYHTSRTECGQKNGKVDEGADGDPGDARANGIQTDTDSMLPHTDDKEGEEEVQKESRKGPNKRRRKTGRPIGRPKRNAAGNLAQAKDVQSQGSKTTKSKAKKKKKDSSSETSEDEQSEGQLSFNSAEEKEKEEEKEVEEEEKEVEEEEEEEENES
ncbi:uncharacterized protein KZ484_021250 [Pholidichthys leucotaenia]